MLSLAGDNLLVAEWVGGPVVWMWWVTVCLTGYWREVCSTAGFSFSMAWKEFWDGGRRVKHRAGWSTVQPLTSKLVLESEQCLPISTMRLKCQRKSACSIGIATSALTKIHLKVHRRPKSRVRDRLPYVVMDVLLAAWRVSSCWHFLSAAVGVITLTSAPVSTRKRWAVEGSKMQNRRFEMEGPVTLVAISDWPGCFPSDESMVHDIAWWGVQSVDDTSKGHLPVVCERVSHSSGSVNEWVGDYGRVNDCLNGWASWDELFPL